MRDLDRLIDGGVAEYTKVEPPAGFEQRILAGARRRTAFIWWFAPAMAAAVCAGLIAAIWMRPMPAPVIALKPIAAPAGSGPPTVEKWQTTKNDGLPHEFPTPRPVTPEERALLSLASLAPDDLEKPGIEPIHLDAIQIEPLEMDGSR